MTIPQILNLRVLVLITYLSFIPISTAKAVSSGVLSVTKSSLQAQDVFKSVRSSVLQIQTMPLDSDSPFSYGSGFVVGSENLIITNYHVVSGVIMDPDRYRLEFLRQDGRQGALEVVAIDVAHDLAVVRGDTGQMKGLDFDQRVPDKGTLGFSIGFPQNQGITVTEGIVNGLSEDSARGAIHFSGPVNSGMSGGPAVNTSGRVFGVNVSNLLNSQLISFIVPATAAVALVERAKRKKTPTAANLFDDLTQQLRLNSTETLALFPKGKMPFQLFGHFQAAAKPGDFARCYATNEKEADKLYRLEQYGCYFKDNTYVANDLYLGRWSFSHWHIMAPNLGALRFASLEQSMLVAKDDTSATNRIQKKRWACQDSIVTLSGTRAKAVLCMRRYSRFEGIYDIKLELVTLADPGDAMLSTLWLTGFGYPESMALAHQFMEAIVWKP